MSTRSKEKILATCIVGSAVYGLFNILAMIFYPGGTSSDKDRIGYSFFENFFSDLGMVRTYGGESNTLSLLLFASALILIGILLVLFFAVFASYFGGSSLERYSSRIGSAAGLLAGLACIGIAATPWDLYLPIHMIFAYGFSIFFLLVAIFYSIAIYSNPTYPNRYAAVFGIYMLVLSIFLCLMIWGPDINTRAGLRLLATGQKVAIYLGMICLFIQFFGAFFYNKKQGVVQAA